MKATARTSTSCVVAALVLAGFPGRGSDPAPHLSHLADFGTLKLTAGAQTGVGLLSGASVEA